MLLPSNQRRGSIGRGWIAAGLIVPAACGSGPNAADTAVPARGTAWYASADDTRLGPFTDQEIVAEVTAGRVLARSLAWHDGADEWTPVWTALARAGLAGAAARPDAAGEAFLAVCARVEAVPGSAIDHLDLERGGTIPTDEIRAALQEHEELLRDARAAMRDVGRLGLASWRCSGGPRATWNARSSAAARPMTWPSRWRGPRAPFRRAQSMRSWRDWSAANTGRWPWSWSSRPVGRSASSAGRSPPWSLRSRV